MSAVHTVTVSPRIFQTLTLNPKCPLSLHGHSLFPSVCLPVFGALFLSAYGTSRVPDVTKQVAAACLITTTSNQLRLRHRFRVSLREQTLASVVHKGFTETSDIACRWLRT